MPPFQSPPQRLRGQFAAPIPEVEETQYQAQLTPEINKVTSQALLLPRVKEMGFPARFQPEVNKAICLVLTWPKGNQLAPSVVNKALAASSTKNVIILPPFSTEGITPSSLCPSAQLRISLHTLALLSKSTNHPNPCKSSSCLLLCPCVKRGTYKTCQPLNLMNMADIAPRCPGPPEYVWHVLSHVNFPHTKLCVLWHMVFSYEHLH